MSSLVIRTSQISREVAWDDPRNVDTTVKSGKGAGIVLAPTWSLVAGIKISQQLEAQEEVDTKWRHYHPITWEQYTEQYINLLRVRYAADPAPFLELIEMGEVCLYCYCKPGCNCHRHIAAGILAKIAGSKGYTVTRIPE